MWEYVGVCGYGIAVIPREVGLYGNSAALLDVLRDYLLQGWKCAVPTGDLHLECRRNKLCWGRNCSCMFVAHCQAPAAIYSQYF